MILFISDLYLEQCYSSLCVVRLGEENEKNRKKHLPLYIDIIELGDLLISGLPGFLDRLLPYADASEHESELPKQPIHHLSQLLFVVGCLFCWSLISHGYIGDTDVYLLTKKTRVCVCVQMNTMLTSLCLSSTPRWFCPSERLWRKWQILVSWEPRPPSPVHSSEMTPLYRSFHTFPFLSPVATILACLKTSKISVSVQKCCCGSSHGNVLVCVEIS